MRTSTTVPADSIINIKLTNIQNPESFRPLSKSLEFQTVTSDNYLIESQSTGLEILNVEPGVLSNQTTGVTPNYWEKNTPANYTIGFVPLNYE